VAGVSPAIPKCRTAIDTRKASGATAIRRIPIGNISICRRSALSPLNAGPARTAPTERSGYDSRVYSGKLTLARSP
jgi:hypothetical protein